MENKKLPSDVRILYVFSINDTQNTINNFKEKLKENLVNYSKDLTTSWDTDSFKLN